MTRLQVLVLGVDGVGTRCVQEVLAHGADPRAVLVEAGWEVQHLVSIDRSHEGVVLAFRVRHAQARRATERVARVEVSRDLAATAVRLQRVSAYALVTSRRGVLLTESSDKTSRPGAWGLPGGGLDAGEHPDAATEREVWEESGQSLTLDGPRDVVTDHWVGAAPNGRIEDFHAVRLIYRAHCDNPSEPVVHDVGGTTRSAAWWKRSQAVRLNLTPWTRALLAGSDD